MSAKQNTEKLILTPQILLYAYRQGIFPMSHEGEIYWYDPDPRTVIPIDRLHVSRSLKRTMKRVTVIEKDGSRRPFVDGENVIRKSSKPIFEIRVNSDFSGVIEQCADPTRQGSWIDEEIIKAYTILHNLGWAHSVEAWLDGDLVGGLYGVGVGGLFAGESMFSTVTDASKVALVYLCDHLQRRRFRLLDAQFYTAHLGRFGAIQLPRETYKKRLQDALMVKTHFIG